MRFFAYPASISHDDTLFFMRGVQHFSLLEFAPHFPGYLSFIFTAKVINFFVADALFSLYILNFLSYVITGVLLTLLVKQYTQNQYLSFFMALVYFSASTPFYTALLLMSDSFGLCLILTSLYTLEKKQNYQAGILLSLALFARPSYIVLILVFFLYKRNKAFFLAFLLTSVLLCLCLFLLEGTAFITEGLRFIQGHFSIWGRGEHKGFENLSWLDVLKPFSFEVVCFLLALLVALKEKKVQLIHMFVLSYGAWMLLAQNPNSPRHLLPFVVFVYLSVFFSLSKKKYYNYVMVMFFVLNIVTNFLQNCSLTKSPLENAQAYLLQQNKPIVLTNYGVETLRGAGLRVLDRFYLASTEAFLKQNSEKKIFLLYVGREKFLKNFIYVKTFKKRVVLEKEIKLFRLKPYKN